MKRVIAVGAALAVALCFNSAIADNAPKSGPQVGTSIPGPFHPLHASGPNAGEKVCLV